MYPSQLNVVLIGKDTTGKTSFLNFFRGPKITTIYQATQKTIKYNYPFNIDNSQIKLCFTDTRGFTMGQGIAWSKFP